MEDVLLHAGTWPGFSLKRAPGRRFKAASGRKERQDVTGSPTRISPSKRWMRDGSGWFEAEKYSG